MKQNLYESDGFKFREVVANAARADSKIGCEPFVGRGFFHCGVREKTRVYKFWSRSDFLVGDDASGNERRVCGRRQSTHDLDATGCYGCGKRCHTHIVAPFEQSLLVRVGDNARAVPCPIRAAIVELPWCRIDSVLGSRPGGLSPLFALTVLVTLPIFCSCNAATDDANTKRNSSNTDHNRQTHTFTGNPAVLGPPYRRSKLRHRIFSCSARSSLHHCGRPRTPPLAR